MTTWKSRWLTITALFAALLALLPASALAAKSPREAVSEMTWGVNLSTLYMTGGYDDETVGWDSQATKTVGYVRNAPMGIGVWFWNGGFDWLSYHQLHEDVFTASVSLPDYNGYVDPNNWFGGMFEIGVFMNDTAAFTGEIRLSGTRLVLSDGSVEYLPALDRVYSLGNFGDYYGDFRNCVLGISDDLGLALSARYSNARLETTVTQISVPFSETGKVDYLFQYGRHKIDQYEITDAFIDQGANTIRLPVSWTAFTDDETFVIDPDWLAAVKTEVDYILSRGCYCILNLHEDYLGESFVGDHWESDWTQAQYSDYVHRRYVAIWRQVADCFRDYPDTLMFETANEPVSGNMNDWYTDESYKQTQIDTVNWMNNAFVEAVRESGGGNSDRLLCLVTPGYNRPDGLEYMTLPEDDHLILTVHSYMEIENTWNGKPADPDWDYQTPTDAYFQTLADYTARTGIPFIIGETGVSHKESNEERAERTRYFFSKCNEYGIPALWWEDYFTTNDGYYYWIYDIDSEWWEDIGIVQAIQDGMQIDIGSQLQSPRIALDSDAVHSDEALAVRILSVDPSAESTRAYVVAADNRTLMGHYDVEEREGQSGIWVPLNDYAPGAYKITVFSSAAGHVPGYASARFTVAEPETILPDFELTADSDALLTHEQTTLRFAAAGADRLEIDIRREGDPYWSDHLETDGQQGEWQWSVYRSGVYTLTPTAWYSIDDESRSRTESDAMLTVTVDVLGELEPVVLNDISHALGIGEGIDGSFDPVDGAQWYYVGLDYCPDEWYWVRGEDVSPENEGFNRIAFGPECFQNPGRYRLCVIVQAYGMESCQTDWYIHVVDGMDRENVALTLDGQSGHVTWPAQRNCPVTITAPGASVVRLFTWYGEYIYWRESDMNENGEVVWWIKNNGGRYPLIAQAIYDRSRNWDEVDLNGFDWDGAGILWRNTSDDLVIDMPSAGVADTPRFHIAEEVERGELLDVTVDSLGDENSPTRCGYVIVALTDGDGNWTCDSVERGEPDCPFTVSLPTSHLEPGTWYVEVIGSLVGYDNRSVRKSFQVIKPDADGEPRCTLALPEAVYDRTGFAISAYADGAGWIELLIQDRNDGDGFVNDISYGADHVNETHFSIEAGRYLFTAIAHFLDENGDEQFTVSSPSVERTVEYFGWLVEPEIRLPGIVFGGRDLTFSVDGLEQADEGYWQVLLLDDDHPNPDGDPTERFGWRKGDDPGHPDSFTVPGALIEDGGHYEISVWVDRDGYRGAGGQASFTVGVGDADLTLPAGLIEIGQEAFSGIGTASVRIPDGAWRIGPRAFADCPRLNAVWIPASVTAIADDAFSGVGACTICAPLGSAAETYAASHGMDFLPVDP